MEIKHYYIETPKGACGMILTITATVIVSILLAGTVLGFVAMSLLGVSAAYLTQRWYSIHLRGRTIDVRLGHDPGGNRGISEQAPEDGNRAYAGHRSGER